MMSMNLNTDSQLGGSDQQIPRELPRKSLAVQFADQCLLPCVSICLNANAVNLLTQPVTEVKLCRHCKGGAVGVILSGVGVGLEALLM